MNPRNRPLPHPARFALAAAVLAAAGAAQAQAPAPSGTIVYRCPGNVYTSNLELSAKQAEEKGCKVVEQAPVTIVQSPRPRETAEKRAGTPVPPRPDARVDPADQRARDSDARRILEAELKREEDKLAAMQKEYNKGEPERRGDERNYQKYLDRVAEMKAGIARKEADIAAIRRELAKLPPS
jgi:hypothetical protein